MAQSDEGAGVRKDFWLWVKEQDAGDDPRGDFIRDTQSALSGGIDPDSLMADGVSRARQEHDSLWRRYATERRIPEETIVLFLLEDAGGEG